MNCPSKLWSSKLGVICNSRSVGVFGLSKKFYIRFESIIDLQSIGSCRTRNFQWSWSIWLSYLGWILEKFYADGWITRTVSIWVFAKSYLPSPRFYDNPGYENFKVLSRWSSKLCIFIFHLFVCFPWPNRICITLLITFW